MIFNSTPEPDVAAFEGTVHTGAEQFPSTEVRGLRPDVYDYITKLYQRVAGRAKSGLREDLALEMNTLQGQTGGSTALMLTEDIQC